MSTLVILPLDALKCAAEKLPWCPTCPAYRLATREVAYHDPDYAGLATTRCCDDCLPDEDISTINPLLHAEHARAINAALAEGTAEEWQATAKGGA